MPELPTETALVDEAWYTPDEVGIAKYWSESNTMVWPGIGEREIQPGQTFMRLAPVATYTAPIPEPMLFGAVIEDAKGRRCVRTVGPDGPVLCWYQNAKGFRGWLDMVHPITVLASGVAEPATATTLAAVKS